MTRQSRFGLSRRASSSPPGSPSPRAEPLAALHLQAIVVCDATCVEFTFCTGGKEHRHCAELRRADGVRAMLIPDALEAFLRPFLPLEPGLVKRLVVETWQQVDQGTALTPLRLA